MNNNLYEKVAPVVKKAGALLLSFYNKNIHTVKKGDGSFVTEADKKVETFLVQELTGIVSSASFYSEENFSDITSLDSDYCWVIDPLDGTTNFLHSIDYFCISVALVYKKKPIFGVIYNPITDELFYGQKGEGAFFIKNDKKTRIINDKDVFLSSSIAVVSPIFNKQRYGRYSKTIKKIASTFYTTRFYGAIALDLAYIAIRRFQAAFYVNAAWWDYAAATIILQESGCKITSFNAQTPSRESKIIVAANKAIYKQLLSLLKVDD